MPSPARGVALQVLLAVDARGPTLADRLAEADAAALAPRERGFLHELVLGTLRQRGRLDAALGPLLSRPLDELEPPVRAALRLGAHQLLSLRVPDRAAVSESVELVRQAQPRATGLVNAVLRRLAREGEPPEPDPERDTQRWLETRGSLPAWLARRWTARLGPAAAVARARALLEPPPVDLRLHPARPEAASRLAGAFATTPLPVPGALRAPTAAAAPAARLAEQGLVWVLDMGSQLVARLSAAPGLALDVCAAPGGKAALLGDAGAARVIALEPSPRRRATLAVLLRRWGAERVAVVGGDALRLPLRARAASVLVDAPCSGLGTLARHPDLRWRVSRSSLARHARRQAALIEAAAAAVAPGGRLVYSTCSSEPEENAEVVQAFRARHPEFAPGPLPDWAARFAEADFVSTRPERDGGDAFCAALLVRR